MDPLPSTSEDSDRPKPLSSPRRTLPEAPPSYYDFPPSYTTNSEVYTDELPAYCPREFPATSSRQCIESQQPPPAQQRVFTVLPRQAYAIRMHRTLRSPPPDNHIRRRLNLLVGTFFILLLATVILVLTIIMTICLV
ncbi:unnamed protein product [Caenorhabditis sp. 36 PRJEB53466]|nr:unnamed protein product [Caenorhabditis sp. 36 PRJEB53466]